MPWYSKLHESNRYRPNFGSIGSDSARLESMKTLKEDVAALKSHVEVRGKSYNDNHGESSWRLQHQHHRPFRKIDFLAYAGESAEKVDVASLHLEGDALDPFSWLSADQTITLWEELVLAFQINFGPVEFQNPDEYLCSIKQTRSVQEYRQEFAVRSARVSNSPENCLLGVFLNGLKEELKTDVRIQKPRTVYNAASLALEYESKVGVSKSNKGVAWSPSPKPLTADTNKSTVHPNTPSITQRTPLRISDTEKQNRYLKGECFRCGEKYGPGHRCKTGTFKLLEASEEQETPINPTVNASEEESGDQEDFAEISLHAIFGKANVTTMKLRGTIGTTEVLILVDGGSTHNFISDSLVRELKMVTEFITPFGVQIRNGDIIRYSMASYSQYRSSKLERDVHDFYSRWQAIQVTSHDMEQHMNHLEQDLALLHDHRFFAKLSKCCFGQTQVVFLGHVITVARVHVEQEKISAIQSWPIPTSVKEVRGFLGLTRYYRRFVCNIKMIARSLTTLTKKDGFVWSTEALTTFHKFKQALMSTPVLRLPDFSKDFTMECDASSEGVGAILSQEDHPVAYFSKGFSPNNRFKSAYDHLLGRHFFICTDHYTLKFLLEQRITTTEQQRLLLKLMPYDFSVTHRAGKENKGADALSCRPHSGDLFTLSVPYCSEVVDIKAGLHVDPYTSNIINQLLTDPTSEPDFSFARQLLFYKQRMVIPDVPDLRHKLLHEAHATPVGGHGGFLKTLKRLSAQYFWPKMKQDVRNFVQQCLTCQQQKYETLSPAGVVSFMSNKTANEYKLPPSNGRPDGSAQPMPRGIFAYNPFFVVYGRDPPPLPPYLAGETKNADLEHQLFERDDMLKLLR
ncbi:ty3-gypsy retrotransposon protein, partial [Tanacetum coccineum]